MPSCLSDIEDMPGEVIYKMQAEMEMRGGAVSLYEDFNREAAHEVVIPEHSPVRYCDRMKLGNKNRLRGSREMGPSRIPGLECSEYDEDEFRLDVGSFVEYFKHRQYKVARHQGKTEREELDSLAVVDIIRGLEREKREFIVVVPRNHYLASHSRACCFSYFIERPHNGAHLAHVVIVDYWGVDCRVCMQLLLKCKYQFTVIVPANESRIVYLPKEPDCRLAWASYRIDMICKNREPGDIAVFAGSKSASEYLSTLIARERVGDEDSSPNGSSRAASNDAVCDLTNASPKEASPPRGPPRRGWGCPLAQGLRLYMVNGRRLDRIIAPRMPAEGRSVVFLMNEDELTLLNEHFDIRFVVDCGLQVPYGEYHSKPLQISRVQALARAAVQASIYRMYPKDALEVSRNKDMHLRDNSHQLLSLLFWDAECSFRPDRSTLRLVRLGLIRRMERSGDPGRVLFAITPRGKAVYDISMMALGGSILRPHNAVEALSYLVSAAENCCLGDAFANINKVYTIPSHKNKQSTCVLIKSLAGKYGISCKRPRISWMHCLLRTLYYNVAVRDGRLYRVLADSVFFRLEVGEPPKYIIILESTGRTVKKYLPVDSELIISACQSHFIFAGIAPDTHPGGKDEAAPTEEYGMLYGTFGSEERSPPAEKPSEEPRRERTGERSDAASSIDLDDLFEKEANSNTSFYSIYSNNL